MSIRATTEPIVFSDGSWKYVPIGGGFTPPIIDHYPEGPGYTRPFERPFDSGIFDGGFVPPIIEPGISFKNRRYPRRNEIPMNPGSLNIPTIGAGGPGVLGTSLLGLGGALAGRFLGDLFGK